ncbi:hypothetical protein PTTG_27399 [Puccinia triticina 1-1 BBBD Race 1]|uniref:Secreted protein n=1 Tax=Puccinia triticina (isolate 1-1 / race 1 (BBBD)) TaxID=630390 RepID=A0A180GKB5_PUCT1|nr:hypothetical protein PTTG_27399 [Puccinia triticina 1-1 BBBD Race 1]
MQLPGRWFKLKAETLLLSLSATSAIDEVPKQTQADPNTNQHINVRRQRRPERFQTQRQDHYTLQRSRNRQLPQSPSSDWLVLSATPPESIRTVTIAIERP